MRFYPQDIILSSAMMALSADEARRWQCKELTAQFMNLMDVRDRYSFAELKDLIDRGADIHATNREGASAMHLAAASSHPQSVELVALLLSEGGDPNLPAMKLQQLTPFHYASTTAVDSKHKALQKQKLSLMIDYGADPNQPYESGVTSMHVWATKPFPEHHSIVDLLMDVGADMTLRNHAGKRADEALSPLMQRALKDRKDEAEIRWKYYQTHRNPLNISPSDLMLFGNIGVLPRLFAKAVWQGHETRIESLLDQTFPHLRKQAITSQPWLIEHFAGSPQHQVSQVVDEGMFSLSARTI